MAVYTEVGDEELTRFIAGYGLGDLLSCKGIAEGVENTNYFVHTTKGTFVLTLYEKRVDPKDLPFFLALMEYLSERGVTCPLPVRDREGRILNEIAGRKAALITFLEGVWPRRPKVVHCLELGKALGGDQPGGLVDAAPVGRIVIDPVAADRGCLLVAREIDAFRDQVLDRGQPARAGTNDTHAGGW